MSDISIDLSRFSTLFGGNKANKLTFSKRVNFIFGRNGTGKTTIATEIKAQLSKTHNVYLFDGYDSVAVNDRLDAIALGRENVEIDNKVSEIDKNIDQFEDQIGDKDKDRTLMHQLAEKTKIYNKANSKIEHFYISAARQIKNMTNPQIAQVSYNKNSIEEEIKFAQPLSADDVDKHRSILMSQRKKPISKIDNPTVNYDDIINRVNNILTTAASKGIMPPELCDSPEKQNFVLQGLRVHATDNGHETACAFCGGMISDKRWDQLMQAFSSHASDTEAKIDKEINQIDAVIESINKMGLVDKSQFYDKYVDELDGLTNILSNVKNENIAFLNQVKEELQEKRQSLFVPMKPIEINTPQLLEPSIDAINQLIDKNNRLTENLQQEQKASRKALRLHHIKDIMSQSNYDDLKVNLEVANKELATIQDRISDIKNKIKELKDERMVLLSQTKDVHILANKINVALKSMGGSSFSLIYEDGAPGNGGYYRIRGSDGPIRDILQLSTGELNIVSFLYFIFSTQEQIGNSNKPYVVVFDDPMSSNDSTMQYLMISKLQELYEIIREGNHGTFILLTHNCNFFLNVRKRTKKLYEKYGFYHLMSNGITTEIVTITNGNEDFLTSYELLWKELVYLYNSNKPDLMLSCCRRICETYIKFNCIDLNEFYKDNLSAKKLFDVNQHSIDDLESELNNKTTEEIKNILSNLFVKNNASDHFENHWSKFCNIK